MKSVETVTSYLGKKAEFLFHSLLKINSRLIKDLNNKI